MRLALLLCAWWLISTGVAFADGPSGEDQMALLVDRSRVEAGLLPLARSSVLDQAAKSHAADMVQYGYMEHEGLDGSTPQSRAAEAGYSVPSGSAWLVVEVISARGDRPGDAVDW